MEAETKDMTNKSNIVALCSNYLGGQWTDAKEDEILIEHLSQGFGNQNYRCVYKGGKPTDKTPSDVVVHIFGSAFVAYDPSMKKNGEVGESIIESILWRDGLAPKLLGVFPGGRIDEFVPSKSLHYGHFSDSEVFLKVAQKLARFHSLRMPISKTPNLVQKCLEVMHKVVASNKAKENSSLSLEIPLAEEFVWYEKTIKKISGRPVFSHVDCSPNNILILGSKDDAEKDVMLIDYEGCSYFYRGYDIGYFFCTSRCKVERADGKLKITAAGAEHNEEAKLEFFKRYLKETKKLGGHRFCPVHDSLECLQLEVEVTAVYVVVILIGWLTLFNDNIDEATKAFRETLHSEYVTKKKTAMEMLGRSVYQFDERCPCHT